jgi:hypothetical protein
VVVQEIGFSRIKNMGRPVLQQAWYAFVLYVIYCEFQPACKNLTDVTFTGSDFNVGC